MLLCIPGVLRKYNIISVRVSISFLGRFRRGWWWWWWWWWGGGGRRERQRRRRCSRLGRWWRCQYQGIVRTGNNKAPVLPPIKYTCQFNPMLPLLQQLALPLPGACACRPGLIPRDLVRWRQPTGDALVWLARAHPLTEPRLWSLPARLCPVTVHPTRWGVGL